MDNGFLKEGKITHSSTFFDGTEACNDYRLLNVQDTVCQKFLNSRKPV